MGSRGRPQYAIVRLPPNADLGALFILLFQNNYSEFKLVNDISEACGCTVPGSSSSAQGAEIEGGDTDSEPRPSPSSLPTSMFPNPSALERLHQPCTSTATPMHVQTMILPKNNMLNDLVVKQEMADVSDVCTSLQNLPTLIQQLQRPAPTMPQSIASTSSGSPSPQQEFDLKTSALHINLDQSGISAHDESDPALNASAGSNPSVELSDHDPTTIPSNLVHLVSSLFPSTSIQNGGEITIGQMLLDSKLQQSRKSLGSVIDMLHSNGTSPVPEGTTGKRKSHSEWGNVDAKALRLDTPKKEGDYDEEERRKRNAEWTYKGDWTCKKCGSLVNPKHRTAQKLLRHMVSHGPRAWSCSGCNSKFGLHTSFVSHNKSVHNGEATPVSLRSKELEDIWFKLAHECFPDFVEQVHSCIKKTTHV
ncbi:unnamed protein product, partial [Mesorhabditis belari]|uniref:C2H2-type domain-containing protein n=1 Tax=Mesorhabditis belari TaxID=2138241 RepID=A0AAF3F4B8_9BILA